MDAQAIKQNGHSSYSDRNEDIFPEEAGPACLNNLRHHHLANCGHNSLISTALTNFSLKESLGYPEEQEGSLDIDHWRQGGFSEGCPCLDLTLPVDLTENSTGNAFNRTSHESLDISARLFTVPTIEESSFENDDAVEGLHSSCPRREGSKGRRLPSEAVKVLRSWLYLHQDYPYPTDQERENLEQQTGLSKTQLLNWFTNARRRKMTGHTINHGMNAADHSLMSPMERWQHSSSESEPAITSNIIRSAETMPYIPFLGDTIGSDPYETCSSHTSNSLHQSDTLSMSKYQHSNSSGSELSYQITGTPVERSSTPIPQIRPRRHRRRIKRPDKHPGKGRASESRPYQCTFCSDSFRSKYDWQRHEKALHLSIDKWKCAPEGGIKKTNGITSCVFCLAPDPDMEHLETHNYIGCRERLPNYRTFSRKDHLVQHLLLTHGVSFHSSMNTWRDSADQLLSSCGFCDKRLFSWQERVDHLAGHFRNNADMDQWQGCWGFEPHIESLVENAMPPYLLGQERRTMDPWKALDTAIPANESYLPDHTAFNALDRYDFVRARLTEYLRNQISAGHYPSDEMIQDEARMIAYGDNDPWNQTYADDPEFIMAIRKDVGLQLWTCLDENESTNNRVD